jgi:hypothetical protein
MSILATEIWAKVTGNSNSQWIYAKIGLATGIWDPALSYFRINLTAIGNGFRHRCITVPKPVMKL